MANSRQWYTSANRAMDDTSSILKMASSILFALKEFLRGGISGTDGPEGARPGSSNWTLVSSCDGTTAGAGDNLGGATFNAAKWVRNTAGNAHSWFVMRSPAALLDGPWEICVSFDGSTDYIATFVIAKGSGAFTGGTTTARPTATHESLYSLEQFASSSGAVPGKCHLITDADGNFFFYASLNGSGRCNFGLMVQSLSQARTSGDAARTVMWKGWLDSSRGVPTWGGGDTSSLNFRGLSADGVTPFTGSSAGLWATYFLGGSALDSLVTAPNGVDAKVDRVRVLPVFDNTVGVKGMKGTVPDTWMAGAAKSVGQLAPTVGTPDQVIVGTISQPGSVALSV